MKHIRKIVSIAIALKDKFGWDTDKINDFITRISFAENEIRKINEEHPNNNVSGEDLLLRNDWEQSLRDYLKEVGIEADIAFTHSVLDVPFKINLGVKYANHRDNVSFVIDL